MDRLSARPAREEPLYGVKQKIVVVEAVSLWETLRVFQGLWEGGEAGFPQTVRVTALCIMRRLSVSARFERGVQR